MKLYLPNIAPINLELTHIEDNSISVQLLSQTLLVNKELSCITTDVEQLNEACAISDNLISVLAVIETHGLTSAVLEFANADNELCSFMGWTELPSLQDNVGSVKIAVCEGLMSSIADTIKKIVMWFVNLMKKIFDFVKKIVNTNILRRKQVESIVADTEKVAKIISSESPSQTTPVKLVTPSPKRLSDNEIFDLLRFGLFEEIKVGSLKWWSSQPGHMQYSATSATVVKDHLQYISETGVHFDTYVKIFPQIVVPVFTAMMNCVENFESTDSQEFINKCIDGMSSIPHAEAIAVISTIIETGIIKDTKVLYLDKTVITYDPTSDVTLWQFYNIENMIPPSQKTTPANTIRELSRNYQYCFNTYEMIGKNVLQTLERLTNLKIRVGNLLMKNKFEKFNINADIDLSKSTGIQSSKNSETLLDLSQKIERILSQVIKEITWHSKNISESYVYMQKFITELSDAHHNCGKWYRKNLIDME